MSGLLGELLRLLVDCMKQSCEALARMAVTCLTELLMNSGEKLTAEMWHAVCDVLLDVFQASTPQELLDPSLIPASALSALSKAAVTGRPVTPGATDENDIGEGSPSQSPLQDARRRAVVLNLLVQTVGDIVSKLYERLSTRDLGIIIDCLEGAAMFAKAFNANADLRQHLVRAGTSEGMMVSTQSFDSAFLPSPLSSLVLLCCVDQGLVV